MNVPKMRTDPRIRQNLNHLSSTIESATDSARAGCFAFTKTYLEPIYESLSSCCTTCCSYIPDNDALSHHGPSHNRRSNHNDSEFPFDFYNDDYWYDYDDGGRGPSGGFLAWGNDELDRLLAGSSSDTVGHRSSPGMYYGGAGPSSTGGVGSDIRSGALGLIGGRRKRHVGGHHHHGGQHHSTADRDPTVIPSTSVFGFLGRFPWWGRAELRYRPSAADLQEHPGASRVFPTNYTIDGGEDGDVDEEARQGLLGGSWDAGPSNTNNGRAYQQYASPGRGRKRSQTSSSGTSGESFRSRGDLFPSDGEDDAVPLGDEFSIVLRGSISGGTSDIDGTSTRELRRGSVLSGMSPAPVPGSRRRSLAGDINYHADADDSGGEEDDNFGQRTPRGLTSGPIDDYILRTQEEEVAREEERDIERKRAHAKRLAVERGLSSQRIQQQQPPSSPPPYSSTTPSPHGLRSRSSPPRPPTSGSTSRGVSHGESGSGAGMGMLSPMSLPTDSPRLLAYGLGHSHTYSFTHTPGSPRLTYARSPTPRSPAHGPRSPTFHAAQAAAVAAALGRPMSPISPLGGSPRISPERVVGGGIGLGNGQRVDVLGETGFMLPPPASAESVMGNQEQIGQSRQAQTEVVVDEGEEVRHRPPQQQEQQKGAEEELPSSILPQMRPSASDL